jgi:hypothetical protein
MPTPITIAVDETTITTTDAQLAHHVLHRLRPVAVAPITLPAPADTPRLGSYWDGQGGVFAGTIRGRDGHPDYHLIVASGPGGEVEDLAWGGYGKESGATSAWDGLANTRALFESEIDHPAAQWASALENEGLADWYLPAQAELAMAWVNVPDLFSKGWHWSSSQFSAGSAWYQYFTDGYQGYGDKDGEFRARAVRRLIIQ